MPTRTAEHVTVELIDGTGNTFTVGPGEGNLNLPDIEADDREVHDIYDRESFQESVHGKQKQYDWSIDVYQDGPFTSASEEVLLDFIRGTGTYATGSATVDPGGVVRHLDCRVTETRQGTTAQITLNTCRVKASVTHSLEGNKIALSGTCKQGIS